MASNNPHNPVSTRTTPAGSMDREQWARMINLVFRHLKATFPAWTATLRTPELEGEMRRVWLMGLEESGISTERQVLAGLARCRQHNSPFLPSIGQFVTWCLESDPAVKGLPSEREALRALTQEIGKHPSRQNWAALHPAIHFAYQEHGSFFWKNAETRECEIEFRKVWAKIVAMVARGHRFTESLPRPTRAPEPEQSVDSAEAERHRRDILAMVGVTA